MKRKINFLGLGFEMGQSHRGLIHSSDYIMGCLPWLDSLGLKFCYRGKVSQGSRQALKIHRLQDLASAQLEAYQEAYLKIQSLLQEPDPLLSWGGDHSVGLSTVGAFSSLYPDGCVVWIDAHADLNLPRFSPSGHLHGMPLSILLNLENVKSRCFPWMKASLSPRNLIYLGIRDLDPFEENVIRILGIKAYTSQDVLQRGMKSVAEEILHFVGPRDLHISFDIDSLSPEYAPATGVAVKEGLNPGDLASFASVMQKHEKIRALDVVEVNPEFGNENGVLQTYLAALEFVIGLFQPRMKQVQEASIRIHQSASP